MPFIKAMGVPFVVSNIDASEEPELEPLFTKSVVVEKAGIRIGVVGVLSTRTGVWQCMM